MPALNPEQIVCSDAAALAAAAADRIVGESAAAIASSGRFLIALAGGSTPEAAYRLLAQPPYRDAVDWSRWSVFFGDERFLPLDHPNSNAHMARNALLNHVPIPRNAIHTVSTDLATPAEAASTYEATLQRTIGTASGLPQFDLVLLGLGDDGHTASLFPHLPSLTVGDAWVTASPPGVLPPPVDRVTFTYPLLNAAHNVLFLVSGAKKAEVLQKVLEADPPIDECPAVGVRPISGRLTWLVDGAAASRLSHTSG